jgi:hypothetical protein
VLQGLSDFTLLADLFSRLFAYLTQERENDSHAIGLGDQVFNVYVQHRLRRLGRCSQAVTNDLNGFFPDLLVVFNTREH